MVGWKSGTCVNKKGAHVDNVEGLGLEGQRLNHVVLDEADRLLDAEFASQVQEIVESCTHPLLQKAVFSATKTRVESTKSAGERAKLMSIA